MHSLETAGETDRGLIGRRYMYNSPRVLACKDGCTVQCCINCGEFLSAETHGKKPGLLFNLTCSRYLSNPTMMWTGANNCPQYRVM